MLLVLALAIIILWGLGFFAFAVGGSLIHLLLVIAVICIIWHFVTMTRTGTPLP